MANRVASDWIVVSAMRGTQALAAVRCTLIAWGRDETDHSAVRHADSTPYESPLPTFMQRTPCSGWLG